MPDKYQARDTDEQSPLIAAQDADDGDVRRASLAEPIGLEDSFAESKSVGYLILLALTVGGLQLVWSIEFSNGSPYLLSLGMSKALLAFVWLAAPLTGVLVQPYIGIVSDRSRIRWGKRRPFMLGGALGTVVSSLLLSYAKEIVWVLGPWSDDQKYGGAWKGCTIAFATVMMWCLDFSVNTVQASMRTFIVDCAPAHQQEAANAWASRLTGVGNVIGYSFGYFDLPKYFHFFGNTQFKVLCVIASIALSSTVLISTASIKERNPQEDPSPKNDTRSSGILGFFKEVIRSVKRLSPTVRSVCQIQFFHWVGWFPFLFYITTYIGQLYVDPRLRPGMSDEEIDDLWSQGTRVGTLALLVYAIVSFTSNILLPFLVVPTYKPPSTSRQYEPIRSTSPTSPHSPHEPTSTQHNPFEDHEHHNPAQTRPSRTSRLLSRLKIPGFTLRRAWMLSQILHALCVFSTFFISTPLAGTVMVALLGLPWSVSLWAPFALISGDIATRGQRRRRDLRRKRLYPDDTDADADLRCLDEQEDRAGIILGLHNVSVSGPQVIATLLSSVVFKALQKDRGTPGDTSVAWTLRVGGLAALVAAWFTWRMKEAGDEEDER